MQTVLLDIQTATDAAGDVLVFQTADDWRERYRQVIIDGGVECPAPEPPASGPFAKGRLKRSKSRNLLERLRDYEADVLRFMTTANAAFTNNQGERDSRMTKVQQKTLAVSIVGRRPDLLSHPQLSVDLSQHGVSASPALALIYEDQLPAFMHDYRRTEADIGAE